MQNELPFVDIHCHMLPGIDDGAPTWSESLAMARIAVADGIGTVIVTPHQLGSYTHNSGDLIRERAEELQQLLDEHDVPLRVLPGADVRIEPSMVSDIRRGAVLSLADLRCHVLLELPHELYIPLEPVLQSLAGIPCEGILSHPERNQGLLKQRHLLGPLVDQGCLMQVTAGSLLGTFGPQSQEMSEWMLQEGLVHFLATDAHGSKSRRPLLRRAYERAAELVGADEAWRLCVEHPACVAAGQPVAAERRPVRRAAHSWFRWRKAA